jgi:CheY-like chemotaxis protein
MIMRKEYSGLENRKILVVEDVELNQYLARHIIESWGCSVQIAENGRQSLDMLATEDFDLILMDIQMPVMDGMEATKNIRSIGDVRKSTTPIVALTANAQVSECDVYYKAGMNDCLPKPIEEPALFRIIVKNIRKEKAQPAITQAFPPVANNTVRKEVKSYDLSMVESISGGDKAFILKMLQLFLDTVPATLEDMRIKSDSRDWAALSKVAHKLKSTVDSMGIAALKQDIRKVEADGKAGQSVDALPSLVDKVVTIMNEVMIQVKKDHCL